MPVAPQPILLTMLGAGTLPKTASKGLGVVVVGHGVVVEAVVVLVEPVVVVPVEVGSAAHLGNPPAG